MKKYIKPNAEIAKFSVEDIITASGVVSGTNGAIVDASSLQGENADMYAIYQDNSANPSSNVSIFTW